MKNLVFSLILALTVSSLAVFSLSSPTGPESAKLASSVDTTLDSDENGVDSLTVMTAGSAVGGPRPTPGDRRTLIGSASEPEHAPMTWTFNHSPWIP